MNVHSPRVITVAAPRAFMITESEVQLSLPQDFVIMKLDPALV